MIPKHIADAAFAVDEALRTAEAGSKSTAITSAELVVSLLRQHGNMGAPDAIGLAAIRHAMRAASLAVEVREEQIRAHGALNVDLRKLSLDELFSKGGDPPHTTDFDWRTFGNTQAAEPMA